MQAGSQAGTLCGMQRELVGAVRIAEAADYLFERLVVDVEFKGEEVGFFGAVLLGENWGQSLGAAASDSLRYSPRFRGFPEVEEAGVVPVVGVAEVFDEARVDALAVHE